VEEEVIESESEEESIEEGLGMVPELLSKIGATPLTGETATSTLVEEVATGVHVENLGGAPGNRNSTVLLDGGAIESLNSIENASPTNYGGGELDIEQDCGQPGTNIETTPPSTMAIGRGNIGSISPTATQPGNQYALGLMSRAISPTATQPGNQYALGSMSRAISPTAATQPGNQYALDSRSLGPLDPICLLEGFSRIFLV
jgi:hypothetical protein